MVYMIPATWHETWAWLRSTAGKYVPSLDVPRVIVDKRSG